MARTGPRVRLLYGQTPTDVAARLSARAAEVDIGIAVTGRIGAEDLGVWGTGGSRQLRCWVSSKRADVPGIAKDLKLEPAREEEANVVVSLDRWRIGTHRASRRDLDGRHAMIAHPFRVWCDLRDERRGTEFAAQLWNRIGDHG